MAEKHKITYYLGAGASAATIPVVSDFKNTPKHILKFFEDYEKNCNIKLESYYPFVKNIKDLFTRFSYAFEKVCSMDTLAKRYFQTDFRDENYYDYKLFLEVIFTFYHFIQIDKIKFQNTNIESSNISFSKSYPDSRYENLIRTVGEKRSDAYNMLKVEIPNNFQFITWNYDLLFESTIANDLHNINSGSAFEIYKYIRGANINPEAYNGANILKLNGTCIQMHCVWDIVEKENNAINDSYEDTAKRYIKVLEKIHNHHHDFAKIGGTKESSSIRFAWESESNDGIKTKLESIATATEIVVLIGYSFPSVNRKIDEFFFKNLKPEAIVYVQGKDYDDSNKTKRLLEQCFINCTPPFTIIPVESGNFFYVPAEYFEEKKSERGGMIEVINEN
ncbi:hypothetical protein [Emticicia fluvialis]|uniref:hypothetical protein n=1 Tax=Emticicia fluvialis TaxID=2974474 RepID=UPI002166A7B0|nr:hypothetical protein [Emticicia fluvialis]